MANIDLFVVDDEVIHNKIVDYVEKNIDETLYQGDERKIFLETMHSYIITFLTSLNELFNQRFAQYAKGNILDEHGKNENCERLQDLINGVRNVSYYATSQVWSVFSGPL